jgi:hypothetical protein
MTHPDIAHLLATAFRAATLAATEPDKLLAGAYVDAGIEALALAEVAACETSIAATVRREARGIGEQLARVAERRLR